LFFLNPTYAGREQIDQEYSMPIPILSIIGKSKSGKTTLLENLIPELKRRGYRVATVKHHSHPGFDIDIPGKDTWRFTQAGSDYIVIAAPDRIASIRRLEKELTLDEITAGISHVDIIFTEGYKRAGKKALEVVRAERGTDLVADRVQLIVVATNNPLNIEVPQLDLNNTIQIADFIEMTILKSDNPVN
jgi:molybdopterin-guanine dinucleotide biosynthesis adapter protein